MIASLIGHLDIVTLFLEKGADVNKPDNVRKKKKVPFIEEPPHADLYLIL